jgi:microcystin-dependent protein
MSIQIDSAQFEILVKKYLDDRQYVETLDELNNVDSDIYPPGIITYCKETGFVYKRNIDNTWTKLDMEDINPYLFIYKDNIPDTEQPIYAHVEGFTLDDVKGKMVFIEDFINMESNNITNEIIDYIEDDKIYSQKAIDNIMNLNNTNSIEYVKNKLLSVIKPSFERVYEISEMTESGTFYLLESVTNPGQFVMYIIDDKGRVQPMGSSNMELNNYQAVEDRRLMTKSKMIPLAINELNSATRKNLKNAGSLDDIEIQNHSQNLVDGLNYNQLIANRIKDVSLLNTENKETLVGAINEIDKKHGDLKRLTTTYKNNFVVALNSFYSANVPAGAIFPYVNKIAPPGYLLCDGADYSISQYPDLFAAIGYNFGMGEDGRFKVPKFEEFETVVGFDPDDEDFMNIGQKGGESMHSLTELEAPKHSHSMYDTTHSHVISTDSTYVSEYAYKQGDNDNCGESNGHKEYRASGNSYTYFNHDHYYTTTTDSHTHTTDTVGKGAPHENKQPYRMFNFIIKY